MPTVFQHLSWGPVRLALTLFAGLEIRGRENIAKIPRNMIIASDHKNQLDPILISACFPFFSKHIPLIFASMGKDYYAQSGWQRLVYGGTFFRLMGAYPMYSGLRDYAQALRHHLDFAQKGKSICIFPRGKQKPMKIPKARGGVGFLAYATQAPILPVSIHGLEDMSLLSIWTGKHKVIVTFGQPLQIKDLFPDINPPVITPGNNPFEKAAEIVMQRIDQL
ncbi:MAG: lysophospholipid acyltransferase family protein [Candidatus Paceibacterota bacterium]